MTKEAIRAGETMYMTTGGTQAVWTMNRGANENVETVDSGVKRGN